MHVASHQMMIQAACLLCICHHVCTAFTSTNGPTQFHLIANKATVSRNPRHRFYSDLMAALTKNEKSTTTVLHSSFYGKFEDFDLNDDDEDDDDDDDDDDEYGEMDQRSIADFKSKMSNLFEDSSSDEDEGSPSEGMGTVDELIEFARKKQQEESSSAGGSVTAEATGVSVAGSEVASQDWARPTTEIRPGTVLVANPRKFCDESDFGSEPSGGGKDFFAAALGRTGPAPSLLAKFGLTQPPPRHLGADRQADLLPVVIVVSTEGGQIQGVLLNRRTGYLLGDLEQPNDDGNNNDNEDMAPILEKFCIQPLWFGGIDSLSVGLDMLHLCPTVDEANQITEDGMYWGGDPTQAQDAMEDPSLDRIYSGFDFKFFVQSTIWTNIGVLQTEVDDKVWFPASVSQNILFKVSSVVERPRSYVLFPVI